jgi:hypothetical protein
VTDADARVAAAACAAVGVLLGLYGAFALIYRGDEGGGDTYVTLAGRRVDAGAVGAVSLALGVGLVVAAVAARRRRRRAA